MASKMTLRSKKIATHVAWSARALAEKAGANLFEKLQPLVEEGEQMPDLTFFQELLGRYLDRRSRHLAEVDSRYSEDQRLGRTIRQERQQQVEILKETLRDARYLLDRQLGAKAATVHLNIRNFARRDAVSLIQLARETAVTLRDPKVGWERAAVRGIETSSGSLAEGLEVEAGKLEQLVQDREGLQSRVQQAGLEEKKAELETVATAIKGGANLLAGLYIFADLPFHAQRVRRRVARKGGTPEEEEPMAGGVLQPGGAKAAVELAQEVIGSA